MDKIKASILIIGIQKESARMYPHLHDCLHNFREAYDEVIYIDKADQGETIYAVDRAVRDLKAMFNPKAMLGKANYLTKNLISLDDTEDRPVEKLSRRRLIHDGLTYPFRHICNLVKSFRAFQKFKMELVETLKQVHFKHEKYLVLAIDNVAYYYAIRYFSNVVLWSYDILAEDSPMRVKGGLLERMVTEPFG